MLRTAQGLRLGGRIERGDGAVGPADPAERGFVGRPLVGRAAGNDPALALDHHRARFAEARPDQRDPRSRVALGNAADPFGPGACLAEAAPRHDQPDVLVACRRKLTVMRS